MKKSLEKIPFVGYSCRVSGHIYVDNSTPAATRRTMATAERQLSGGMSVVVFPEGARALDGRLHRFRRGAFILATEFGLPVVPITIDGAYDVMPRGARCLVLDISSLLFTSQYRLLPTEPTIFRRLWTNRSEPSNRLCRKGTSREVERTFVFPDVFYRQLTDFIKHSGQ